MNTPRLPDGFVVIVKEECETCRMVAPLLAQFEATVYTQDDPNLAYILNPRTIESKVGDTANIKKTSVEYRLLPNTTIAEYGLVSAVNVYDANQSTILKRAETDYNLSSIYISKRIIGLPSETRAFGVPSSDRKSVV